ncbi:MAG: hypothetical protein ACP5OG_03445 [Candidatus Nanoarchaeia archaeon]
MVRNNFIILAIILSFISINFISAADEVIEFKTNKKGEALWDLI